EGTGLHQAAGARGRRQSLAAHRAGAGPAGREHHGVLQAIQCADPEGGEGAADPGGDHGLHRSQLHLHHEDAARLRADPQGDRHREGKRGAQHQQGGQDQPQAARGNRENQAARPDCRRSRGRRAHHRRQRAQHGRGRGGLIVAIAKRMKVWKDKLPPGKQYPIEEALKLVKEFAKAKFDETIDAAVNLGIDASKSDQQVRGSTVMPNGTGKTVRVAVFTSGKNQEIAKAAGADIVGLEDLAAKVKAGEINFDRVIASPDAMRVVGQLGQILGPRGLMPNPKVGTVTPDVATAVKNAKAGQVTYRVDKAGIVHCTIGKASFEVGALKENLTALIADLQKAKPASSKGQYLKRVTLSSTMGPGVVIDQSSLG